MRFLPVLTLAVLGAAHLAALGASTALAAAAPAGSGQLEVRSGPGADYPRIGLIPAGADILVHQCIGSGRWCDVDWPDGRGWVDGRYITMQGAADKTGQPEIRTDIEVQIPTIPDRYLPDDFLDPDGALGDPQLGGWTPGNGQRPPRGRSEQGDGLERGDGRRWNDPEDARTMDDFLGGRDRTGSDRRADGRRDRPWSSDEAQAWRDWADRNGVSDRDADRRSQWRRDQGDRFVGDTLPSVLGAGQGSGVLDLRGRPGDN